MVTRANDYLTEWLDYMENIWANQQGALADRVMADIRSLRFEVTSGWIRIRLDGLA